MENNLVKDHVLQSEISPKRSGGGGGGGGCFPPYPTKGTPICNYPCKGVKMGEILSQLGSGFFNIQGASALGIININWNRLRRVAERRLRSVGDMTQVSGITNQSYSLTDRVSYLSFANTSCCCLLAISLQNGVCVSSFPW